MNHKEKRGPGRPRKQTHQQRVDFTLPERIIVSLDTMLDTMGISNRSAKVAEAIANYLTLQVKEKENQEELNEATAYGLLGRFQNIIIRSIERIDINTITPEEWQQIRGTGALVGNAPVYGAWMVTWTPAQYANAPFPWKVMVVKSTSPLTGEPAFMTTPARGEVPVYFE